MIWCVLVSLYRVETWPASFRLTLASDPSPFPSTVRVSDSQPASASPGWPPLSPVLKSQLIQLREHKVLCPGNRTKPIQASQSRVHDILETRDPVKTACHPNHPGNSSHWEIAVEKLKARQTALRGVEELPPLPSLSPHPEPFPKGFPSTAVSCPGWRLSGRAPEEREEEARQSLFKLLPLSSL